MQAYTDYFAGKLKDLHYDEGELAMALAARSIRDDLQAARRQEATGVVRS